MNFLVLKDGHASIESTQTVNSIYISCDEKKELLTHFEQNNIPEKVYELYAEREAEYRKASKIVYDKFKSKYDALMEEEYKNRAETFSRDYDGKKYYIVYDKYFDKYLVENSAAGLKGSELLYINIHSRAKNPKRDEANINDFKNGQTVRRLIIQNAIAELQQQLAA